MSEELSVIQRHDPLRLTETEIALQRREALGETRSGEKRTADGRCTADGRFMCVKLIDGNVHITLQLVDQSGEEGKVRDFLLEEFVVERLVPLRELSPGSRVVRRVIAEDGGTTDRECTVLASAGNSVTLRQASAELVLSPDVLVRVVDVAG
jgi:hypothetical protein